MRGLDYKWIEALNAVVTQGGFERAAEELFISQSAISQQSETVGEVPCPASIDSRAAASDPVGKKLIGLYQRIRLLEHELIPS